MKRLFLCFIVALLFGNTAVFADDISIYVNDSKLEAEIKVENNRILVPMRIVFESLGAEVEWFNDSQSILATKGSKIIALKIGTSRIVVRDIESGETVVSELDVAPVLINSKTMVPIRAVSEALNADVLWNGETRSVYIKN